MRRTILFVLTALLILGVLWWRVLLPRNKRMSATDHFYRSEEFAHRGQWREATRELRLALQDDPTFFEARDGLASIYSVNDQPEEAVKVYEAGIRLSPEDARLHYLLGHLFFDRGRYDDAIRKLQECLRLAPKDRHYAYLLGMSYERAGRLEEAREHWRSAAQKHPGDPIIRRGFQRVEQKLRKGKDFSAEGAEEHRDHPPRKSAPSADQEMK